MDLETFRIKTYHNVAEGYTICATRLDESYVGVSKDIVVLGISKTSPKDQFSRRIGRTIAKQRVLARANAIFLFRGLNMIDGYLGYWTYVYRPDTTRDIVVGKHWKYELEIPEFLVNEKSNLET